MDILEFSKYKNAFLVLAVLIALLEIPGGLDLRNAPYTGFQTDGNNTVTKTTAASPAVNAGFMVGDFIKSINGIDTKDTQALARQSRAKIGETWAFTIEREGETKNLSLTFASQPPKQILLSLLGAIIGFCFLLFGMMAYLRIPSKNSTLLALVGLCLGFTFINQMYFYSYTIRTIYTLIGLVIVIFGIAALLHFLLSFPKEKEILHKRHIMKIIYGPATLITLFAFFLIIFQPDGTSSLNTFVNALFGLFVLCYFGLAAISMIHSYIKATKQERSDHGLNFMLLGTIMGFAPVLLGNLVSILAPKVVLPGSDYFFITMVLIPISLAIATMKKETAAAMAAPA